MRGGTHAAMWIAAISWAVPLLSACTSSSAQCDCADPAIHVTVPDALAAAASAPLLSGACAGDKVTCAKNGGTGCVTYVFTPSRAGTCHLDVDFATGRRFSADVQVISATGCCAGFFANPPSAGDVVVPEGPDAGA